MAERAERRHSREEASARRRGPRLRWLGVGVGLGAGVYVARRLARRSGPSMLRHVKKAVTIRRPPEEVYAFWRRLENLPRFMHYIDDVQELDERRSRWRVRGPAGALLEWEAEVVDDRPGEHVSWRSVNGADVENAGSVYFVEAPGGRGTEVYLELHYAPPAGRLGVAFATLFRREPAQQALEDLRRLKQVLETGQVVHSDATVLRGLTPARPPRGELRSDDETLNPSRSFPGREGEAHQEEAPR